ncbi:hypothetical protein [Roseomonas chloroacetimidivorans]|uniref:hypothetical protein n=1 Tax=Roseomonas chloroacetimidivorans TaxID=1766656 RepID=UPI003C73A2E5
MGAGPGTWRPRTRQAWPGGCGVGLCFDPREGGGPPLAGFLDQQSELWAAALRETGIRIE